MRKLPEMSFPHSLLNFERLPMMSHYPKIMKNGRLSDLYYKYRLMPLLNLRCSGIRRFPKMGKWNH